MVHGNIYTIDGEIQLALGVYNRYNESCRIQEVINCKIMRIDVENIYTKVD
jgi:hypothetical protein